MTMHNYKVVYELDGEEREFFVKTTSPTDASDDCYYEMSDEGEGYKEIRVIDLGIADEEEE